MQKQTLGIAATIVTLSLALWSCRQKQTRQTSLKTQTNSQTDGYDVGLDWADRDIVGVVGGIKTKAKNFLVRAEDLYFLPVPVRATPPAMPQIGESDEDVSKAQNELNVIIESINKDFVTIMAQFDVIENYNAVLSKSGQLVKVFQKDTKAANGQPIFGLESVRTMIENYKNHFHKNIFAKVADLRASNRPLRQSSMKAIRQASDETALDPMVNSITAAVATWHLANPGNGGERIFNLKIDIAAMVVGDLGPQESRATYYWEQQCKEFEAFFKTTFSENFDRFECGRKANIRERSAITYASYAKVTIAAKLTGPDPDILTENIQGNRESYQVPGYRSLSDKCKERIVAHKNNYKERFIAAGCGEPKKLNVNGFAFESTMTIWVRPKT